MPAALFSMRCFKANFAERPECCISYIIYGSSDEQVLSAGDHYLQQYKSAHAPGSKLVHKSAPQFLFSFLNQSGKSEWIDWPKIAERVTAQKNVAGNGSSIFRKLESSSIGKTELLMDELTPELQTKISRATHPIPADLLKEIECGLGADIESAQKPAADGATAPGFLFLGSAYDEDRWEREGEIVLLEAASLDRASEMVSEYFGWLRPKRMELTEWCCPVFPTEF